MEKPVEVYWTIKKAGESFSSLSPANLEDLLSPSERSRLEVMKIPKRRNEWLLGRLTAKGLLTSNGLPLNGTPYKAISIENQPEGAPFISSHPEAGTISITHREHIAATAFIPGPDAAIGIDLEWIEPRQFSFVEDFFTPNEVSFIKSLESDSARDKIVTLIWSAKEAILKVWQKGLRLDTRHIEIHPIRADLTRPQDQWQPLSWQTDLDGYPDCWLGWRRWGNFIITLAASSNQESKPPQISEVRIENPQF